MPKEVENDREEVSVPDHDADETAKYPGQQALFGSTDASALLVSLPKEIEESETFDEHADDRPLAEDEDHAREEADGAADLLFPREEVEGLLGPDEQCDTGGEENIPKRK